MFVNPAAHELRPGLLSRAASRALSRPTARSKKAGPSTRMLACAAAACVGFGTGCRPDPARMTDEATVETTFELFPADGFSGAPWKCAVALPTIRRGAEAMRMVVGADERAIPLEYPTAEEAIEAVAAGFAHYETSTMRAPLGGVDAVRDAIEAGAPAIVPFRTPTAARAVVVAGYRTVESEEGQCTHVLQDILVVDTVDVIAYGMPLRDFQSLVASPDVLAVLTSDAAAGPLTASGFAPR